MTALDAELAKKLGSGPLTPQVQAEIAAALKKLSPKELADFRAENARKREEQLREAKLYSLYPDTGILRRELYPKHMAFFAAGGKHEPMPGCPADCDGTGHQERALIAANRVGKTTAVCYELTLHAIGWYPHWWVGRRFNRAVTIWFSGEDAKSVRESLQVALLGPPDAIGTGLIPKVNIVSTTARPGVPDAVDSIMIKTSWGGTTRALAKSYDQGREAFQAATVDIMVFDEEPPQNIYSEGHTRVLSTVPGQPSGIVLCSFTPLKGLTGVVLSYLPGGQPSVR